MQAFRGQHVVTSILLTKPFDDWSQVRSPARARRRLKRGHPQRIRHINVPDPSIYQMAGRLHMHPETFKRLVCEAKTTGTSNYKESA